MPLPGIPTQEELARTVNVAANVTAMFGGKEYDLSKGVNVPYGMVYHWENSHKDVIFTYEDVKDTPLPPRDRENPLEENDRGEAFAGLKRRRTREV